MQTLEEQYDGQYFEWTIGFRSFTINAQFLIKIGGNLFVHLIKLSKKFFFIFYDVNKHMWKIEMIVFYFFMEKIL